MADLSVRDARRRFQPTRRTSQPPIGRSHALVVGIDRYAPPLRRLTNAANDAKAIAKRLRDDFGFQVTQLTDEEAHAAAIRAALERLRAETATQDRVLFFFAGHGSNHPDRPQEGFLLPADATESPASWLAETEIVRLAQALPARWIFLVLDACYSGTTFRADLPAGARDDQVLKALVAGTEDQPVLDGGAGEHSVFTRAIMDGLDGWADSGQRPDDMISADELIAYVEAEVPWRTRLRGHEQTPQGGPLQGSRTPHDFEFLPVVARLPAPLLRNLYSPHADDRVAAARQLGERAPTDNAEVRAKKAAELIRLSREDRDPGVRNAAIRSLGWLGHPDGYDALAALLRSSGPVEVRAAAAAALGDWAYQVGQEGSQAAVETLISTLDDAASEVIEAAKGGLGRVLEAGPALVAALEGAPRARQRQIVDALACLADAHPEEAAAWPALGSPQARLWRRIYLAYRRLYPAWPDLVRRAILLGVCGAIGLGLACALVVWVARRPYAKLYIPAVLVIAALPGLLTGAGYALLPRLAHAVARRPRPSATAIGAILAGLLASLWIAFPHWFLGLGCGVEGCPPHAWLFWLLPGAVVGPLVGWALATPQPLAAALVGAAGMAAIHIPAALSFGNVEPHIVEVALWGLGGAILGAALSFGWEAQAKGAKR